MKGTICTGITSDVSVRIYACDTTGMVEEARKTHNMTPVSTAAVGRLISAASLMGRMLKNATDSLTVQVRASNEIKSIVAVSDYYGNVKAYTSNPDVVRPARADGKLDVGGAVGTDGQMIVIKDYGLKEPFAGTSDLVSGEIAEDLAAYYMHSEQQPSVVSLGVLLDDEIAGVKAAGGFIIQPLPFAEEEVIEKIERSIENLRPMSEMLADGMSLEEIMREALKEFEVEITDQGEIEYKCDCSRERIESALISLGKKELNEIIEEDGQAELSCHFCNKKYVFSKEELIQLVAEI